MRGPAAWSLRVGHACAGYHHLVTNLASDRAP